MQRLLVLFALMAVRVQANEYSSQENRSLMKKREGLFYALPLLNRVHFFREKRSSFFIDTFTASMNHSKNRIKNFKPDCSRGSHAVRDCSGSFIGFVAENTWSPIVIGMAAVYALQQQVFLTHLKAKNNSLSNDIEIPVEIGHVKTKEC